jgi:AraC family transcriptional regulator
MIALSVNGNTPEIDGLAPWQIRSLRQHIEVNIAQRLTNSGLASFMRLSSSHFSRAFKRSFGVSVHRYVMQRRVEQAQMLLLNTSDALSHIAINCGMSDQSHLTRWFRRIVGVPPGLWRRNHREPVHT